MHTAIYSRQSKGNDRSIDRQAREQADDITNLGWNITKTYSDGVSASRYAKKRRTDWPKLLIDIEEGNLDAVCLWEASRGDRNLATWVAFLDLCLENGVLIRVTDNKRTYDMSVPDDYKSLADAGTDSRHESEKTRQRIMSDQRSNAAKGRPGGRIPYGYAREYDQHTKKFIRQYPHPDKAPVVVEAAHRMAEGGSITGIANDFNARGIAAPDGGKWQSSQVRRLVTNREYCGVRVHNGTEYPAVWEAIIDEDTWQKCQAILATPGRRTQKDSIAKHLLSGIITCAVCGGSLRVVKIRGVAYYRCKLKFCAGIQQDVLDEFMTTQIKERLFSYFEEQVNDPEVEAAREAAKAERDQLQDRLDDATAEFLAGRLSAAVLGQIEQALRPAIQDATRRAQATTARRTVYHDLGHTPDNWDAMSVLDQRHLLKFWLQGFRLELLQVGKVGRYTVAAKERVRLTNVKTGGVREWE